MAEAPPLTLLKSQQTTTPPIIHCGIGVYSRHGVPVWQGACRSRYATGDGTIAWYVGTVFPYDGRYHYLHYRDEVLASDQGLTVKDGLMQPVPEILDRKSRTTLEGECKGPPPSSRWRRIGIRIDAEPDLRLDSPPVLRYFMNKYRSVEDWCPGHPGPSFWSFFVNGLEVATLDGGGGSKGWVEKIEAREADAEQVAKKALDQQLRALQLNSKQEAFTAKYRIQKWVNPDQLQKDLSEFEDQIVGLYGQFHSEIDFDKADFLTIGGQAGFTVFLVEPGQFKDDEQVVLAVKVRGMRRIKVRGVNYTVPDLAYVGSERCATINCRDYE